MPALSDHRSTFRINSYISSKGITTRAASSYSIDPTTCLDELLAQASPERVSDGLCVGFQPA